MMLLSRARRRVVALALLYAASFVGIVRAMNAVTKRWRRVNAAIDVDSNAENAAKGAAAAALTLFIVDRVAGTAHRLSDSTLVASFLAVRAVRVALPEAFTDR